LETESELTESALLELMQDQQFVTNEVLDIHWYNSETTIHKLTHQHLNINFLKITVKGKLENGIDWESAKKMPFPIVIFNFIEKERF
jgi:A/G-specific adenine glycosylase